MRVALTQGDHNGVGIEVLLKAFENPSMLELVTPVIFADRRLVEKARAELQIECPEPYYVATADKARDGRLNVVDLHLADATVEAGKPTVASGAGAVASLEAALAAVTSGAAEVLVTAPISKEAVQSESFRFPGHTEFLEARTGAPAQMILFDDRLRVALVTTHLPISGLAGAITREKVESAARRFSESLQRDFGISRPKIAVLSLNPHCGDGGLLGSEEEQVIKPAIQACIEDGLLIFGPYASDGLFGSGAYKSFDGVLAMYHDQGLAPFKALAGEHGVNFTAGLPIVRTSPDHGTAYDIAWQGRADAASMHEAIYKGVDICRNRERAARAAANPLKKQVFERPPRQRRQGDSDADLPQAENPEESHPTPSES